MPLGPKMDSSLALGHLSSELKELLQCTSIFFPPEPAFEGFMVSRERQAGVIELRQRKALGQGNLLVLFYDRL